MFRNSPPAISPAIQQNSGAGPSRHATTIPKTVLSSPRPMKWESIGHPSNFWLLEFPIGLRPPLYHKHHHHHHLNWKVNSGEAMPSAVEPRASHPPPTLLLAIWSYDHVDDGDDDIHHHPIQHVDNGDDDENTMFVPWSICAILHDIIPLKAKILSIETFLKESC